MDEHRALTAHEQQAFHEIQDRLRDELDLAPLHTGATVVWSLLIVTGSLLRLTGLIVNIISVAFAGFVVVLIGVERFTQTPAMQRWCQRVERWTGLLTTSEASHP